METSIDDVSGKERFQKLYICFEALKKMTSRLVVSIIGVDGCHLRGPHTRVLLTLVEILQMIASTLFICHSGGRK